MLPDVEGNYEIARFAIELVAGGGAIAAILVRMGKMAGNFEEVSKQQTKEISEIDVKLQRLAEVITLVAVQKSEMAGLREQMSLLMNWYDDLRRGRGFIGKNPE